MAFVNADGSPVLVVLNETYKEAGFNAELDGRYAPCVLPAHSIATLLFNR